MIREKMPLHRRSMIFLFLCSLWTVLTSCASKEVEARKTPGADLWMYHTYSWRPKNPTSTQSTAEQEVREQTDLALSERGYIRLTPTGNPDFWINEQVAPQAISLEFTDAHTGKIFWKGRSVISRANEPISRETISSSVDLLVNRYIAAQEWMPASFWWKGIDLVGSS